MIKEAVYKTYLKEDEKAKSQPNPEELGRECDFILTDILEKVQTLEEKLKQIGISENSPFFIDLKKIYKHLSEELHPISTKIPELTKSNLTSSAEQMVAENNIYEL